METVPKTDPVVEYNKIMAEIQTCNSFKYSAYRTAYKLLILHRSLGFEHVSLDLIKGVLNRYQINSLDNYLILNQNESENILYDIFFAASKKDGSKLDFEMSLELTKMFLNNVLLKGKNCNSVLFLKVVLICLSAAPLQNKYQYWFSQLVDHNLCLPRRRLQSLLQILLMITDYLSESNTFSECLIEPTLDSCFLKNQTVLGISENDFNCWLKKEPQLLVWFSTFHRLCISMNVIHNIQCSTCGVFPIIGLRYHCLQCIHYDLCQICFFTARSNKHHKPRHIIREYCTQSSFYETATTFVKEVFKRLCGHSTKLQYLPANISGSPQTGLVVEKDIIISTSSIDKSEKNKHQQNVEDEIRRELQRITCEIEEEARLVLSDVATELSTNYLIDHQAQFLQERLDKIKALQFELLKRKKEVTLIKNESSKIVYPLSPENKVESTLCVPNSSGFDTWLESNETDETYSKKLHSELEHIMEKLNSMLESNFSIDEENSLL